MKLAQQRRLITRRNRALTRFSIIEVPDSDDINRRRYIVTLILLTLAIVTGLLI